MNFVLESGSPLGSVKRRFATYREAARFGRANLNYGTWHVACPPSYVPSREDQLLEEPKHKTKKEILDDL